MSATDAAIQKKMYGSAKTVKFSNKDLGDMTKIVIVKALEDSDALMKGITETLKNDIKKEVHYL